MVDFVAYIRSALSAFFTVAFLLAMYVAVSHLLDRSTAISQTVATADKIKFPSITACPFMMADLAFPDKVKETVLSQALECVHYPFRISWITAWKTSCST